MITTRPEYGQIELLERWAVEEPVGTPVPVEAFELIRLSIGPPRSPWANAVELKASTEASADAATFMLFPWR